MAVWSTPPGPRGVLCDPPVSRWNALAEANRRQPAQWEFDIAGVPAAKLRTDARRKALELAGLANRAGDADGEVACPLFVTGHQPEFYHPGVWMKAFAAAEAARLAGGLAFNWVVDHDAGELAAEIPRRERIESSTDSATAAAHGLAGVQPGPKSDLRSHVRRFVAAGSGRPFETLPVPTPEQTEAFVAAVDEDLATLGLARERELWRTFADGLLALADGGADNAAELGWRSRAAYEKALGGETVPDAPFSAMAGTREFLLFFVHWVTHAEELLRAYNRALAEVRQVRRLRSAANPFPDLLIRPDQGIELPFWGLTPQGIRRKLYVRRDGDRLILSHLEGEFAAIPAAGGEEAAHSLLEAGVQIRPRAVPLTLFTRLFVADVFVHGTGGARYDEVTDLLIRDFFGVEPPAYAVVSATFHLPLGDLPVQPSALRALERKLRDLTFNPQRYAWEAAGQDDNLDRRLGALVREKERLIEEIAQLPRRRGPRTASGPSRKRVLTRAIEKTNVELYALLGGVEGSVREQLAHWRRRARSGEAATRRTYPFFFYDPKDMWKLLRNGGA